jgi:hypothetical protein
MRYGGFSVLRRGVQAAQVSNSPHERMQRQAQPPRNTLPIITVALR